MKIIIDARLYGLENAGLGRYVINLVENLKKIDEKNNYLVLLRKEYYFKLHFPKNWQKVLFDFRHYSLGEQIFLPLVLYRNKPDLVHFPHFNVPILYFGKFVVTIHDTLMHKFANEETTTLPKFYYLIRRLGYKAVFYKAVKASSFIVVPSNFVKEDLIKIYGLNRNKIFVTYEGVDRSIFNRKRGVRAKKVLNKYRLKPNEYFIYSGNAYPHKNLKTAIAGFKKLNKDLNRRAVFAICSSRNVFFKRLEEYIDSTKALAIVKLLGFVPDSDYKILLNHSIGFIFPSLSEGFGLPGLEAMASGTLLLASDIPVFREIYSDHAIYFNPKSSRSISDKLVEALEISLKDDRRRNKMLKSAGDFVKKYSWFKMTQETLEVYKE
jgi:glycosyltransferase involved in cell wall biosynthesis